MNRVVCGVCRATLPEPVQCLDEGVTTYVQVCQCGTKYYSIGSGGKGDAHPG